MGEGTVAHKPENNCYLKLICVKSQKEKVVGFHYLGPNAGEVTQGFGMSLKMGATKADFDNLIGIHPTTAETFTTMGITKSSGWTRAHRAAEVKEAALRQKWCKAAMAS